MNLNKKILYILSIFLLLINLSKAVICNPELPNGCPEETVIKTLGSLDWNDITNFPAACPAGQFVTQIGTTLICSNSSTTSNEYVLKKYPEFNSSYINFTNIDTAHPYIEFIFKDSYNNDKTVFYYDRTADTFDFNVPIFTSSSLGYGVAGTYLKETGLSSYSSYLEIMSYASGINKKVNIQNMIEANKATNTLSLIANNSILIETPVASINGKIKANQLCNSTDNCINNWEFQPKGNYLTGNIFNQNLNTTNNVEFNKIKTSYLNISDGSAQIELYTDNSLNKNILSSIDPSTAEILTMLVGFSIYPTKYANFDPSMTFYKDMTEENYASLYYSSSDNKFIIDTDENSKVEFAKSFQFSNINYLTNPSIKQSSGILQSNLSIIAASTTGTNKQGGTLILSAGSSTGTGVSRIQMLTSKAGSSGSTERVPSLTVDVTQPTTTFYCDVATTGNITINNLKLQSDGTNWYFLNSTGSRIARINRTGDLAVRGIVQTGVNNL